MNPLPRSNWQTLEPLLDQALELAPEARSRWLAELSVSSPELAADVEAFLAEEAAADRGGFLTGVRDVSLAGLELGAYRLERQLGQGGMGTVWLAQRADGRFEGQAAVKLLNLALVSTTGQERFRREGSVLARLAHPGIARLLDAGVSPAGQPYLVLEYVDGQPIDLYVRERKLPQAALLRLFLQVLAAVGHAHANLIVHRDLKPSNIFVTTDGTVKLLDFGIAKLIDDESANDRSLLTAAGGRIFTPHFAAPEQVHGADLTTATDVYALGVLLYLLLSGRHPTAEGARTPAECVTALLEAEPARLGLGDLDTVLAKALRKLPVERYQTVAAFADDLERYLRQEPVSARTQSLGYRLGKFVRRNRIIVTAAVVTLAALVGASGFSLGQARRAARERDVAVRASERAEAVMGFQRQLLTQIGDRPMTMKQILDGGLALLQRRHTGQQTLTADLLAEFGSIYSDLGDSRTARTLLARAESLATAGGELPLLLSIRCATARLMVDLGHLDSVAPYLALFDRLDASQAELTADSRAVCLDARGSGQVAREQGDSAIATWQQARTLLEAAGRTRSESYQVVLGQLGAILVPQGRTREAIAMNRRQLAALDSSGQSGTLLQLNAMSGMAFSLLMVGEVAEAESLSREGVQLVEASGLPLAGQSPTVLNRATITFMMGWYDSSLVWFSHLAEVARETGNPSRERRALFGRGRAEAALGRLAEARQTLARIKDLRDSATAPPSREELHLLGWERRAQAEFASADRALTELLRRDGYFSGGSNPGTRPVLLLAAEVAIQLGDPARALKLAGDARQLATVDSLADVRSAFVGEARLLEARALLASNDTMAARASIDRALPALRAGAGAAHHRTREAEALAAALGR